VGIAKKNVRLSVQRNRVKRNIRETFRHYQHPLQGSDVLVLARRGLDQLDNKEMQEICNQLWHQLEKRAEKRFRQREG
jgi:ribonuclease P protein component